jgi:hypothetical protein
MDWLILLLLIQTVLAPVGLMYGFAGCSFQPTAGISVPANLTATAIPSAEVGSAVNLNWEVTDPNSTTSTQIERAMEGGDFVVVTVVTGTTFTDQGLAPGTTFLYQLRATNSSGTTSTTSNMATVTTFKTAFADDGLTNSTDQPNVSGFTIVQILASTLLQAGGALASLTLRGPASGTLTLDTVCISGQATAGDPFDSDVTPVVVANNVALNNGTLVLTPMGSYVVDQTKPLLVAFDVNLTANTMRFGTLPQDGAISFAGRPPTMGGEKKEAGQPNRTAPYTQASALYLVQKIEVI